MSVLWGPTASAFAATSEEAVVATVGGEPIRAGEVTRLLGKALAGKQVDEELLPRLRDKILSEIVARRLVMAYARRTRAAPSDTQVDAEMARFESQLAARGGSLQKFLAEQAIDREDLRRQLTWNLVWAEYHKRYLTDARAEAYFQRHRRELDGTAVSVSHILLRPSDSDSGEIEELLEKAREIRAAILAGETSFPAAARKYSFGPSAEQGGKLGAIGRRGPMVEAFGRAAFELEPGELSPPVQTQHGVHIIRCDAVTPGSKQLSDVREEIDEALARELLEKLAKHERQHTPVEYVGKPAVDSHLPLGGP